MNWIKLSENRRTPLKRGSLIKFPAAYPFEGWVVMMICDTPGEDRYKYLITVSGYKAGINNYSCFPAPESDEDGSLLTEQIYENWRNWVWPEGSPDEAWILPEGLTVKDFK